MVCSSPVLEHRNMVSSPMLEHRNMGPPGIFPQIAQLRSMKTSPNLHHALQTKNNQQLQPQQQQQRVEEPPANAGAQNREEPLAPTVPVLRPNEPEPAASDSISPTEITLNRSSSSPAFQQVG